MKILKFSLVACFLFSVAASAGSQERFYKGKTVRMVVTARLQWSEPRGSRGADYFKTWSELPAFEYNEVENVYRFMRHIEKNEGRRVLPIPGPKH